MLAHYLQFHRNERNADSFVGGLPKHLPSKFPWDETEDNEFAFVLQLATNSPHLHLPGITTIQLYQPISDGDDPTPFVIPVLPHQKQTSRHVHRHPMLDEWDISFIEMDDPEVMPNDFGSVAAHSIFQSKIGGLDVWRCGDHTRKYLLQLKEGPAEINFGGLTCIVVQTGPTSFQSILR